MAEVQIIAFFGRNRFKHEAMHWLRALFKRVTLEEQPENKAIFRADQWLAGFALDSDRLAHELWDVIGEYCWLHIAIAGGASKKYDRSAYKAYKGDDQ